MDKYRISKEKAKELEILLNSCNIVSTSSTRTLSQFSPNLPSNLENPKILLLSKPPQ